MPIFFFKFKYNIIKWIKGKQITKITKYYKENSNNLFDVILLKLLNIDEKEIIQSFKNIKFIIKQMDNKKFFNINFIFWYIKTHFIKRILIKITRDNYLSK